MFEGLVLVVGIFSFVCVMLFRRAANKALKAHMENLPYPVFYPVTPGTLCSDKGEPHKWELIPTVDVHSRASAQQNICLACGNLAGSNKQLRSEGIAKLKLGLEKMKAAEMLRSEQTSIFCDRFVDAMNREMQLSAGEQTRLRTAFLTGVLQADQITNSVQEKLKK